MMRPNEMLRVVDYNPNIDGEEYSLIYVPKNWKGEKVYIRLARLEEKDGSK